ncbi:D-glycero-alpha-D-manno-heptose-1,7-bisphosphate 7-phosphatase [Alicyclobacillus dauci]|uniref:D,D-heptose 1,7-bisphosphate phosphatase n=1 Tax=Alicyclobacillus dauci TaxID=1475485 RepID=A0ABY6Z874_9BACL|nr:HAD family hydrolase [Alicyclobacillus dauci]WAH38908.1 HAD family hydrolase [Alicyclobacillus dauci]
MRAAVFLDRDGVINDHRHFVNGPDDLYLFPYSGKAIAELNRSAFFVGVVTNQGGIGLGYSTEEALHEVHNKMQDILVADGAHLDAIHYCPHAPKAGCTCRKPKPGMILEMASQYHLDLERSYMVGDRDVDILAGKRAGCKTVLVGEAELPDSLRPDAHCSDLLSAVEWILQDTGQNPQS